MDLGRYLSLVNHFVQTNFVHNLCQTHYLKILRKKEPKFLWP